MKNTRIYLSNSKLNVINKIVFIAWIFAGIACFVWAFLNSYLESEATREAEKYQVEIGVRKN